MEELRELESSMYEVKFKRPEALTKEKLHYCPGCEHGILTRLVGEVIDELGIKGKTVMVDSVGCSVLAFNYFDVDHIQAPHGRAPAVAAGLKRYNPNLTVYTIQGDGDALAIGLSELLYAGERNEPITIFLVNNGIYGMTGGQMAPTTLEGMKTTTTPLGRDTGYTGVPMDSIQKMLTTNASYIKRASLVPVVTETESGIRYSTKSIADAKKSIRNAFKTQMMGGCAFVEFISTCSINWGKSIPDAKKFANDYMLKQYKPGLYRDRYNLEGKA